MQRLLLPVAIFFSLSLKRGGEASVPGFCVPADDATLEGTRTEHNDIFHVSQTLD